MDDGINRNAQSGQNPIPDEKREAVYGGCRYRLNYDKYVEKSSPKKKGDQPEMKKVITVTVVVTVAVLLFIFAGIMIFEYFTRSIRTSLLQRLNGESTEMVSQNYIAQNEQQYSRTSAEQ